MTRDTRLLYAVLHLTGTLLTLLVDGARCLCLCLRPAEEVLVARGNDSVEQPA